METDDERAERWRATAVNLDQSVQRLMDENKQQRATLAAHVPCQACAWMLPRAPEDHEEPPIVRGALDAQAEAEQEAAALRAQLAEAERERDELQSVAHVHEGIIKRATKALDDAKDGREGLTLETRLRAYTGDVRQAVDAARAEGRREAERELESGLVMLGLRPVGTTLLDLVATVGRALGEQRAEGRRDGPHDEGRWPRVWAERHEDRDREGAGPLYCFDDGSGDAVIANSLEEAVREAFAASPKVAPEPERCDPPGACDMDGFAGFTWYAYEPDNCIQTYDTREDARASAEESCEFSGDAWPEDQQQVEWGLLVPFEVVEEYDRRAAPEGSEWDYMVSYRLRPCDALAKLRAPAVPNGPEPGAEPKSFPHGAPPGFVVEPRLLDPCPGTQVPGGPALSRDPSTDDFHAIHEADKGAPAAVDISGSASGIVAAVRRGGPST